MDPSKNKTLNSNIPLQFDESPLRRKSRRDQNLQCLSALIKISTAIGFMPTGLKETLQFLASEAKKLFGARFCAILLLDGEAGSELICSEPPAVALNFLEKFNQTQQCVVVRDELPFIIQDVKKSVKKCGCLGIDLKVKSYACLPISTGTNLVGVLIVGNSEAHGFSPDRLEMMLSVASMAASAIQRTQLFKKLEQEKSHLEKAYREIRQLNEELESKVRDLKEAQDQIIRSEKLAAAGRLAAGVSHELNNPIGVILNRIECLLTEAEEMNIPNELLRDLQTISQYAHKISLIVRDLSIFSRTTYSEPHFDKVSINDILGDVFFLIEQKIRGKRITLTKDLSREELFVSGDYAKLEQVFINIIDNAIDAIPGDGWIRVSTGRQRDSVRIQISDSGCGVPEEHLNKIYDPFFTTKEVGKGTGLGLTISDAIVKDHGGSIDVKTRLKQGTTFTITLPAYHRQRGNP